MVMRGGTTQVSVAMGWARVLIMVVLGTHTCEETAQNSSNALLQGQLPGLAVFVRGDRWGPRGEGYEGMLCAVRGTQSETPSRCLRPQITPSPRCAAFPANTPTIKWSF